MAGVKESLLGLESWTAAAEEVSLQTALRKVERDGADVTSCGRQFQTRAAATGKARSPIVDSRVRRTNIDDDVVERRLALAGWLSSSARYGGATPRRHLYTRRASL